MSRWDSDVKLNVYLRVCTIEAYLVKTFRRNRTYMHDRSLAPRNDASLLSGNLGTSGKIIMGYLARGSGIRAILLQSRAKFYNFFHVRVFKWRFKNCCGKFFWSGGFDKHTQNEVILHTVLTLPSSKCWYVLKNCLFLPIPYKASQKHVKNTIP